MSEFLTVTPTNQLGKQERGGHTIPSRPPPPAQSQKVTVLVWTPLAVYV